jgi:hypothetical protein
VTSTGCQNRSASVRARACLAGLKERLALGYEAQGDHAASSPSNGLSSSFFNCSRSVETTSDDFSKSPLEKMKLTDYRIRVLNPEKATAARVRVFITTTDGEQTWDTVGVDENIIEASWQALIDGIEYYYNNFIAEAATPGG